MTRKAALADAGSGHGAGRWLGAPLLAALAAGLLAAPAGALSMPFHLDTSGSVSCNSGSLEVSCVRLGGAVSLYAPGTTLEVVADTAAAVSGVVPVAFPDLFLPDVSGEFGFGTSIEAVGEVTGSWEVDTGRIVLDPFAVEFSGALDATESAFAMGTDEATELLCGGRTILATEGVPLGATGGPLALVGSACVGPVGEDERATGSEPFYVVLSGTVDAPHTVLPEPGTGALLGLGLLGLGGRGLRARGRRPSPERRAPAPEGDFPIPLP